MKRQMVFVTSGLIIALLVAAGVSTAQGGVPALPANATQAVLLFPDLIQDGQVSAGMSQQQYTLLAASGDVMVITARMSAPGLITAMQLSDAAGNVLVQQAASSAAPSAITLSYQASADGWYLLDLAFGAAASGADTYTLALTGTTSTVFDLLKAGAPPAVAKAHVIASVAQVSGDLTNEPVAFLIPVEAGDQVGFTFQGTSQPSLKLITFDASGSSVEAATLGPAQSGTAFTSDKTQWIQVNVVPAQAGTFVLSVSHPRASGMAQAYFAASTGLTVVSPGTGGTQPQPVATTAAPAQPVSEGPLCGGVPARFKIGDMVVVSQKGDNLQILKEYTGGTSQAVELAVTGDILEILDNPVCYTSPYLYQDVWMWNVYSHMDQVSGWVVDGIVGELWICPQDDPSCDYVVTCPAPPVQFKPDDMIVVSETGDNLQFLLYPGSDAAISLAVKGQELRVLGGPKCYYSAYYAGPIIYWNVYSKKDGTAGWVADGGGDQRWVCPVADPKCDQ